MICQYCGTPASGTARFCQTCGQPLSPSEAATRTSGADETRLSDPSSPRKDDAAGWLSSSGSIDHGRFAPGTMLDGRYRVIGLLGRGGMGEVYRADDLRLGQPVALKFLPPDLARDPTRLAQFHNEVRTARQVSHANVCRVYDIGDLNGQLFLTMEYVDGEDLSSLLRRIGRLPEAKAIEIGRQICAGLAAAHDRGVLHRDLKPANIMLDGAGRARLMDFSLASVGAVTDIRAGTPAYMAPEQIEGREVTAKSDIFALGLVLYELFTGKRAFDAPTIEELVAQHQSGSITSPSDVVKGLDPVIERAIMRCLESAPARRPSSALAVAASLPGGDPLAAALAAGETPSPDMVAAAGGDAAVRPAIAVMWFGLTAVLLLSCAIIVGRTSFVARSPVTIPPAALADRADQLRQSLGYTDVPADRRWGFTYEPSQINWTLRQPNRAARWTSLPSGRPSAIRFWYRTSPLNLVPISAGASPSPAEPPLNMHGMTTVVTDPQGRLLLFEAAPAQVETSEPAASVDWDRLFAAAALDRHTFAEAAPGRAPVTFADERKAWHGTMPGTSIPISVEAASVKGRPVYFAIISPWTVNSREPADQDDPSSGTAILVYILLLGAALAAYFNARSGRADLRGAFRLAVVATLIIAAQWILDAHVSDLREDQQRMFMRLGMGMFLGGAVYLLYLGLEPLVRKSWPSMLVGWSRVLRGQWRDPLVGRDILIGMTAGAGLALVNILSTVLPAHFGLAAPTPVQGDVNSLLGTRQLASMFVSATNSGLQQVLINVFEYSAFRVLYEFVMRRIGALKTTGPSTGRKPFRWALSREAADSLFFGLAVLFATLDALNVNAVTAGYVAIGTAITLLVLLRAGIFASVFMFVVNTVIVRAPWTFDGNRFYGTQSWAALVAIGALAGFAFWLTGATNRPRRSMAG